MNEETKYETRRVFILRRLIDFRNSFISWWLSTEKWLTVLMMGICFFFAGLFAIHRNLVLVSIIAIVISVFELDYDSNKKVIER